MRKGKGVITNVNQTDLYIFIFNFPSPKLLFKELLFERSLKDIIISSSNVEITGSFPQNELSFEQLILHALFNIYAQENLIILNCTVIKNKVQINYLHRGRYIEVI